MKIKRLVVIIALLLVLFPFALLLISMLDRRNLGGDIGVRTMTHACRGIKIYSVGIMEKFPKATIFFQVPLTGRGFNYNVPKELAEGHFPFCLGIDVWYGE